MKTGASARCLHLVAHCCRRFEPNSRQHPTTELLRPASQDLGEDRLAGESISVLVTFLWAPALGCPMWGSLPFLVYMSLLLWWSCIYIYLYISTFVYVHVHPACRVVSTGLDPRRPRPPGRPVPGGGAGRGGLPGAMRVSLGDGRPRIGSSIVVMHILPFFSGGARSG